MGVTTLVTGNCGTSARNIGQLLDGLDRYGGQVNVATLVGHNTIRESIIGAAARPASSEEVEQMSGRIAEALAQGAFGLSTGLAYSPGNHASEGELVALARAAATNQGIYATHLRDEGLHVGQALEEALRIGREADIPVHVSHMKVASRSLWGRASDLLRRIDVARSSGMRVTMDAYAYTASSTSLDILMPPDLRGTATPYRAILKDPRRKSRAISGMLAQLKDDGFSDYSFARIAYFHRDHSLEGLAIPDVAVRVGLASHSGRATIEVQAETVLALLARGGAQMIYFTMSEEDMLAILRHPQCSIGTDTSVRSSELRYAHPRGVGNFPRILGQLVREKHALSMDDALRKMTGSAADAFGFRSRGRIQLGAAADLTVFDPQSVADKSSYEHTLEAPSGIRWVLVNGVPVVDPDGPTGANPGRVIRGPGWAGFRGQITSTKTGETLRPSGQGTAKSNANATNAR
jgi:N-acyl-D-amino-acid deacylase